MKKILIVEDYPPQIVIFKRQMKSDFELLFATTHQEALKLFSENSDIELIVMDACLKGEEPDTILLVTHFRKTFSKTIIATSSNIEYRQYLVSAGCDLECDKNEVAKIVSKILQ